jgi:hypothetical protein
VEGGGIPQEEPEADGIEVGGQREGGEGGGGRGSTWKWCKQEAGSKKERIESDDHEGGEEKREARSKREGRREKKVRKTLCSADYIDPKYPPTLEGTTQIFS